MKKQRFSPLLLASVLLLTACGTEAATDLSIEIEDEHAVPMQNNPYFDTSDLEYAGIEKQNIAIGVEFENSADNNPMLTYQKYLSPDGEVFAFDELGRLCRYTCGDGDDLNAAASIAIDANSAETAYTSDQIVQESLAVAQSLLPEENDTLKASVFGGTEYIVTNEDSIPETEAPFTAILDVWSDGKIRDMSVSYDTLSAPIDYDYFEQKLNAYIERRMQETEISAYSFDDTPWFEQIGDKVYGMYTITFQDEGGDFFCESVGFTQEVEGSSSNVEQ